MNAVNSKLYSASGKDGRSNAIGASTVAKYLSNKIESSGIKQSDLAHQIGYSKPNIITMFKQGLTKLPISKVKVTAEALNVDPVHLLRLVLEEYQPETLESIEEIVGYAVSDNEMKVVELLRETTKDADPVIHSKAMKELKKVFKDLV